MKNILFFLACFVTSHSLHAQLNTMCGNGDFESGQIDPAEWTGYFNNSACDNPDGIPCILPPPFTQAPANTLAGAITSTNAYLTIVNSGEDPNIMQLSTAPPSVFPNPATNNYSLRIGNRGTNCGHEKIAKTFVVDAVDPVLRFWYASVMQDPGDSNHSCSGSDLGKVPGFGVFLFDQSGNDISNIVDLGYGSNFNYFDDQNNFFQLDDSSGLYYTDWRCVCVDLRDYIGEEVTVEFYNRDCRVGGHFGYSYIDNVCLGCYGSSTGSMALSSRSDTCGLPGEICIDYTLPYLDGNTNGEAQFELTILQNGSPVHVFNSPVVTSGNQYCFDLNVSNLPALNNGLGGFDYTIAGHFSISDDNGNTTNTNKYLGFEPEGMEVGLNNDHELVCSSQCGKLSLTLDSLSTAGLCCYTLSLLNELGEGVAYVEANLISSDWVFATGATTGSGFSWLGQPGPNSLPVALLDSMGVPSIPVESSDSVLTFCLEPTVEAPSPMQTVVFTWYEEIAGVPGYLVSCLDTVVFNCIPDLDVECLEIQPTVNCNPANVNEYLVTFTVTNQSSFPATQLVLDNLENPVAFGFSACDADDHLPSIAIPFGTPLAPGATSELLCVKIHATDPVLSPANLNIYAGLITPEECCTNEEQVQISLQPCCNPCSEIQMVDFPLQEDGAGCCYSMDIENNCPYDFFTKVETKVITPGVEFGYHALGGPSAQGWNIGQSTPTSILWEMNGNAYIPHGTTMDLIQFCLDDIEEQSEVPQLIQVSWITEGHNGKDSIACMDTLRFNCEPVVDYNCLEVSEPLLECFADSNLYCYTFTVKNVSDIPFGATNLDLFEASGAPIEFIGGGGTFPLPPLNQGDSIRLTACFVPDMFPLVDSFLVFQYRLRYLMGDTCCYESSLDTVLIEDFCAPEPPHDCCYPAFVNMPTGLSPNGDGLNDQFVIQGIESCQEVTLRVFNRWGQVVFEMDDYDNSWSGTNRDGEDLPQGTYYILLTLHDSGSSVSGYVDLRRY